MMITAFRKWWNYYIELRKSKRLDSWYRRKIKKRTEREFITRWNTVGHVNHEMMKKIADIMELPNHFILPYDRMSILFCSPYDDCREIEALNLLEKYGILNMNEQTIQSEYKYAKDIFRII